MSLLYVFRVSKWQFTTVIAPFFFPLVQTIAEIELSKDLLPLAIDLLLEIPFAFIFFVESFISQPFAPLLRSLGWWSNNGIFVAPNGPLLPGSFLVAFSYSLIIYTILSLIGAWRTRQKLHA